MRSLSRTLRGIRWRIIGAIVAVVALGQLAFGLVQADQEAEQLRADARAHGLAVLGATVEPLAVPLANRELTTLDAALARIAETQRQTESDEAYETSELGSTPELPLRWVAILDTQGTVLAHTDPAYYGENWSKKPQVQLSSESTEPLIREVMLDDGPGIRLAVPIQSGLRWGTALTEISMVRLEAEIADRRQRVLTQSLILSGILAALLSLLIGLLIVSPITRLSAAARAISDANPPTNR